MVGGRGLAHNNNNNRYSTACPLKMWYSPTSAAVTVVAIVIPISEGGVVDVIFIVHVCTKMDGYTRRSKLK